MSRLTKIGRLNERIEFYQTENVKDSWGEITPTQTLKYSCWATIRTPYLKEIQANIGTVLENTVTFITRYQQDTDIKSEWFIMYGRLKYQIIQINPDLSNKEFTTIIAKRIS